MKKSIIYKLAAVLGVIGMAVFVVAGAGLASGLSYQSRVDVEFTFEPSLSLTVSAPLRIDDLDPGMMAESNTIQVTVGTNNAYGYTLTATTGNASNPSRELRHSSYLSAGDPVFSSLPLNANLSKTEFLNNSAYNDYWGYSTDGETYSGLPLYSDTENAVTLLSSNYMPENGTATTNFMLGAKASMDKEAGSYSNVINFVAVGAIDPTTFMQNWAGCKNLKTGRTTTLVDSRDYKTYKVAKLADGKCWIHEESGHVYGPKKITAIMHKQGKPVSARYVRKLMIENGLSSVRSPFNKNYAYVSRHLREASHASQDFKVDRINQVWVSDTSAIYIHGRYYYICVYIDLFSRKVVGWGLGRSNSTQLVKRTFQKAFKARKNPKNLIIHCR